MRSEQYTGLDVAPALSQTNTSGVFIQWLLWLSAILVTPLIMQLRVYCAGEQTCSCMRIFPLAASPASRPTYLELLQHHPPAVGCGAVFLIATKSFTPNNATLQQHNLICSCSLYFHYPFSSGTLPGKDPGGAGKTLSWRDKIALHTAQCQVFPWQNSGMITCLAFHLCHAEKIIIVRVFFLDFQIKITVSCYFNLIMFYYQK